MTKTEIAEYMLNKPDDRQKEIIEAEIEGRLKIRAKPLEETCGSCIERLKAEGWVHAVRCRNCKHYDCEDGDPKCVKDAEWSEEDACYYGFIAYHGPEFFCADGERR